MPESPNDGYFKPRHLVPETEVDRIYDKSFPHGLPNEVFRSEIDGIVARRKNLHPESGGGANDTSAYRTDPAYVRDHLTGIALSGGGIRSATFCLGVLQALAKADLLKRFDYLSTVSGGGYLGTSLAWLLADDRFGVEKNRFPFGHAEPSDKTIPKSSNGDKMLRYLREHGNYLVPGNGITLFSGIGVVLRGIFLNLLVWIPLLTMTMLAFMSLPWFLHPVDPWHFNSNDKKLIFELLLQIALYLGIAFALASIFYSLRTALSEDGTPQSGDALKWYQPRMWVNKIREWFSASKELTRPYYQRRKFERWVGGLIKVAVGLVVVGSLPFVNELLREEASAWIGESGGVASAVFGIIGGVWTFLQSRKSDQAGGAVGVVAPIAAALLIYGIAMLCYQLADVLIGETLERWYSIHLIAVVSLLFILVILFLVYSNAPIVLIGIVFFAYSAILVASLFPSLSSTVVSDVLSSVLAGPVTVADQSPFLVNGFVIATLVALATGWWVNLNEISIHRYYRDRLMETFLPDVDDALANKTEPAHGADLYHLPQAWNPEAPKGPYPIINTNLVLVDSDERRHRMRGGDNFALTPLYCGGSATGWRRTERFMGGNLTLATAMAISGAAANPNAGCGGVGLTRSGAVSLLMSLLNVRLGYWVPHPNPALGRRRRMNHFEIFHMDLGNELGLPGGGYRENRYFLHLSDGGHFENTGLYELLRRKTKLIVACDGEADGNYVYEGLQTALARAGEDFGVCIDVGDNLERPIPNRSAAYPQGVQVAARGFFDAEITYNDGTKGKLIYLKSTLIGSGLEPATMAYKGAHPAFPHETTADQFFDEGQFEAYRDVGYRIAETMLADSALNFRAKLSVYCS